MSALANGELLNADQNSKTSGKTWQKQDPGIQELVRHASRCYNPKAKGYQHYGGRGIKVAPEFLT